MQFVKPLIAAVLVASAFGAQAHDGKHAGGIKVASGKLSLPGKVNQ